MQVTALTEWLASPETRALVKLLERRRAAVVGPFLAGTEVSLIAQGRAMAFNEIANLLNLSDHKVRDILEGK